MGVRPSLPLAAHESAWEWVFWLAPAGALLGLLEPWTRLPESARFAARWGIATGGAWLVVRPLAPHAVTAAQALGRAAAAGLAAEVLWSALVARARRGGGLLGVAALGPALFGASYVLYAQGHSYLLAAAAGALATAVATLAVLGRRDPAPLPATTAPVVALAFAGLLLGAHAYLNFGDVVRFPWPTALLLAASACCVGLPRPRLAVVASVVLAAAATFLAARPGSPA
jgi:hypothetical protein